MKTRPEILLHPNIPKPLHGIAPRVIKGKAWWDEARQIAYASTNYHCAACGVPKKEAKYHAWLEAHELYKYDYDKGRLEMIEIVPLCHACHNYIHSGRMNHMVSSGEMTREKYMEIIEHGDMITDQIPNIEDLYESPNVNCNWSDWKMIVDGKEYGPSTKSMAEWLEGKWRNWKP